MANHDGNAAYVTPSTTLVATGPKHSVQESTAWMETVHRKVRRGVIQDRFIYFGMALGIAGLVWFMGGNKLLELKIAKRAAEVAELQATTHRQRATAEHQLAKAYNQRATADYQRAKTKTILAEVAKRQA